MRRLIGVWGEPNRWVDFAKEKGYTEIWLYVPYSQWDGTNELNLGGLRVIFVPIVGAEQVDAIQRLVADDVSIVGITDENIPPDINAAHLVRSALEMLTGAGKQVIWVRPGLWYVKHGPRLLGLEYYIDALAGLKPELVMIEDNPRFLLPPPSIPAILTDELGFSMIPGNDARDPEDIPVRTVLPVFLSEEGVD